MTQKKPINVTLRQIAQECGVSKATVSLALRNRGSIAPETAKRIQAFSHQIGYRRNGVAKGSPARVAATRTRQVVLPFNEISIDAYHRHNFFEYIAGISAGMTNAGINLQMKAFRGAEKELSFMQSLFNRERNPMDGLINFGFSPETTRFLLEKKIPMVGVGEAEIKFGIPCVTVNKVKGYMQAWEYVRDMGHSDVAFLGFNDSSRGERLRQCRAGASLADTLDCLKHIILVPKDALALDLTRHLEEAFGPLHSGKWPTLIFAQTDLMAYNLITGLQIMGLKVPDDISVIGFDDVPIATQCTPPLTTLKLPFFQMGLCAAHLLASIIDGQHKNTGLHYSLPVELVLRDSVRSLANSPAKISKSLNPNHTPNQIP